MACQFAFVGFVGWFLVELLVSGNILFQFVAVVFLLVVALLTLCIWAGIRWINEAAAQKEIADAEKYEEMRVRRKEEMQRLTAAIAKARIPVDPERRRMH